MGIGLGLFFGMIFCGVIYLYTQTKDRWNWGKGGKIFLYLIGTPIALFLIFAGGNLLYEEYQNRPKVITEFKGVQLGEKLEDVIFKQGKAERDETRDVKLTAEWIEANKDKISPSENKDAALRYKFLKQEEEAVIAKNATDGGYLFNAVYVNIKNNKVDFIGHVCGSESYDDTELNGIRCNSTGDKILKKFGNEVRVLCSMDKNGLRRAYDVAKYGTRYYLDKNTVYRMGIFPPAALESNVGKNWGKCS